MLKPEGTLWVIIGDSYAGSGKGAAHYTRNVSQFKQATNKGSVDQKNIRETYTGNGLKPKDLIGIPWMLALALRKNGWYLRQDIIWSKSNPMPESVTDRCTKSHEYILLLSKSQKYYYNAEAIAEPIADSTVQRLSQNINGQNGSERIQGKTNGNMKAVAPRYGGEKYTQDSNEFYRTKSGNAYQIHDRRNKRDVWTISTKPFKESHFATFPPDLIEPCILAGCPENGVVIDIFMGSGTTGLVAKRLNRNYIGIELNQKYINIAEKRIREDQYTKPIEQIPGQMELIDFISSIG